MIIFQDTASVRTDTSVYVRYLNFSPRTNLGVRLVSTDTTKSGFTFTHEPFVGYNIAPTNTLYAFIKVPAGSYQAFAFVDSAGATADSSNIRYMGPLQILRTVNYNVFLQGIVTDTGKYKLRLGNFALNAAQ